MHKQKCKVCGETKVRVRTMKKKGENYIYADEHGKRWSGLTCYVCYYQSVNPGKARTKRRCRTCGKTLNASRYFNHDHCVSTTSSNYDLDLMMGDKYGVHL